MEEYRVKVIRPKTKLHNTSSYGLIKVTTYEGGVHNAMAQMYQGQRMQRLK